MFNTKNDILNKYLYLVLTTKISYFIVTILYLRSKYKKYKYTDNLKKTKNIIQQIFNFLLIFLIIFLFNPFRDVPVIIDLHIRLFLFAFGIMALISNIQNLIIN